MKALFSKAKLGKLRNFLSLLLIMGCYVIYQRFLVVAYYDIGLFIVVTVVAILYDKLIASKGFDAIVNNACICWVVVGLSLVLRSYYLPEKIYKVPLNGFSTFRVDSHPLKTIFQHKACTNKLYADSFYKVQKNSHSSFEVICCRS